MSTNSKGLSLHLGLNQVDPAQYEGWDGKLAGCENDARDMEAIAKEAGFTTKTLLTDKVTATAASTAIADAAGELDAGDIFLLTYSGHGGQMPDTNGDEPDQLDETWVFYDRQLVDDELFSLWGTFKPGVRIFVLSDSCHSGSAVRETIEAVRPDVLSNAMSVAPENGMRAMPRVVARQVYEAHQSEYDDIQKRVPAGDSVDVGAHVLLVSGCQDNQTSADGAKNGLFTETLLKVWGDGKYQGAYRRFYKAIVEDMPPWQSPNWFRVGPRSAAFERSRPFTI